MTDKQQAGSSGVTVNVRLLISVLPKIHHRSQASAEDPRYVIRNDNVGFSQSELITHSLTFFQTGKETAYKADNIKKAE